MNFIGTNKALIDEHEPRENKQILVQSLIIPRHDIETNSLLAYH